MMLEWNKRLLESGTEIWADAMARTDNFCAEIRSKAEVDRQAENTAGQYDDCMGRDTSRVTEALKMLEARGFLGPDKTALDIGSGTGTFALPLAERMARVTALDISAAMQDILRGKAQAAGRNNIEYRSLNWREADLAAEGMEEKYDLVLDSLNTRGICNYETLNKMNRASRAGCCIVSFTGGGKKNHTAALNRLILGRQLTTAGGNDIIMPFNLIYHMGGKPELSYSKIEWENTFAPERAVESICRNFWRFADISAKKREEISEYVKNNLEPDGLYHERAYIPVAVMVWDARLVRETMGR